MIPQNSVSEPVNRLSNTDENIPKDDYSDSSLEKKINALKALYPVHIKGSESDFKYSMLISETIPECVVNVCYDHGKDIPKEVDPRLAEKIIPLHKTIPAKRPISFQITYNTANLNIDEEQKAFSDSMQITSFLRKLGFTGITYVHDEYRDICFELPNEQERYYSFIKGLEEAFKDSQNTMIMDHERYSISNPLGDFIARGCWGKVYKGKDSIKPDKKIAIKVFDPLDIALKQMGERNLDEYKAMFKEFEELRACSNIVPRHGYLDKNNRPFIVMPLYERFLSDILDSDNYNLVSRPHKEKRLLRFTKDMAHSIYECHTVLKRAHGDIKPDNFAVDKRGNLLLNDLGSATCCSAGMSVSPRDNIGPIYTRAPECFQKESRPTKISDVWAFGSLAYRMITGKYILEDELDNAIDPEQYINQMDKKVLDPMIKKKIRKNVPKIYRKFLMNCLDVDPLRRYSDGEVLHNAFEKLADSFDMSRMFKRQIRKFTLPVALPALAFAGIGYLAVTHVPEKIEVPTVKVNQEIPLYVSNDKSKEIVFIRENLPMEKTFDIGVTHSVETMIRNSTDNKYVCHFAKAYHNTLMTNGSLMSEPCTDEQYNIYMRTTTVEERKMLNLRGGRYLPIFTKAIEFGISKAEFEEGKVDLEDMCTIARVGLERFNRARDSAKSPHFSKYSKATDFQGKPIIPESDQYFIRTWLSYID